MPPKVATKPDAKAPAKGQQDPLEAARTETLMESGQLEGYEFILKSLCKAGLPEGNIFDFASGKQLQFESKWKTEQKRKEKLLRYKEGKFNEEECPQEDIQKIRAKSARRMKANKSPSPGKKEEEKEKEPEKPAEEVAKKGPAKKK